MKKILIILLLFLFPVIALSTEVKEIEKYVKNANIKGKEYSDVHVLFQTNYREQDEQYRKPNIYVLITDKYNSTIIYRKVYKIKHINLNNNIYAIENKAFLTNDSCIIR